MFNQAFKNYTFLLLLGQLSCFERLFKLLLTVLCSGLNLNFLYCKSHKSHSKENQCLLEFQLLLLGQPTYFHETQQTAQTHTSAAALLSKHRFDTAQEAASSLRKESDYPDTMHGSLKGA